MHIEPNATREEIFGAFMRPACKGCLLKLWAASFRPIAPLLLSLDNEEKSQKPGP